MAEETVKQEGEFSLKSKKTKPKQLGKSSDEPIKVNMKEPLVELPEQEITKVIIKEEDATKEQSADEVLVRDESKVSEEVSEENIETTAEEPTAEGESPIIIV